MLAGEGIKLNAVSSSYWADSQDIFVGSLVAIAFFLAAYNGTGDCNRDAEYILSKFAGFFALIVAFFPTGTMPYKGKCQAPKNNGEAPEWVIDIAGIYTGVVHLIAAILLFICLFWLMTFFSRRAFYKGKIVRSNFYAVISWGMAIGMPLTLLLAKLMGRKDGVFWLELLGLWLFGFGWLVAGSYKADPVKYVLSEAQLIGEWQVDASSKNFPSGLTIQPGKRYLFKASGCWKDWWLLCGPTGWGPGWKWFTSKNRLKGQPFFMLCGNIDKRLDNSDFAFPIGNVKEWIAPAEIDDLLEEERKLYFFANDWESRYGNNKGLLTVKAYELD